MSDDLTIYTGFLITGKWISKADFIYRVKLNFDCTEERNSRFLRVLYDLRFSMVKKDNDGRIILQY